MKKIILSLLLVVSGIFVQNVYSQSMSKKHKTITIERILPFSADKVWDLIATNFDKFDNYNPEIYSSDYTSNSSNAGVGTTRKCTFDKKGKKFVLEEITHFDNNTKTHTYKLAKATVPMDTDNTQVIWKVEDLGKGKSKAVCQMKFRMKPAMMTGIAKGKLKKGIVNMMNALEHHLATAEIVNKGTDNFKTIKA
jgi:uncharacterized protein YndB with AHSA1/START domain